jgi:hypothetical protein
MTRHSSKDYIFKLFDKAIDWKAVKQKTVTTSTTKTKLLAISHTIKKIYWWNQFYTSIQLNPGHKALVDCDNQQIIDLLIKNLMKLSIKLQHINIHGHWLHQEVQAKQLRIRWVPTTKMPADKLTKALTHQKHKTFVKQLELVNIQDKLEDSH